MLKKFHFVLLFTVLQANASHANIALPDFQQSSAAVVTVCNPILDKVNELFTKTEKEKTAEANAKAIAEKAKAEKAKHPVDILDSMIAIAIILFLLSMIVEKITQILRKYSPFVSEETVRSIGLQKTKVHTVWRNINASKDKRPKDSECEKIVEREIATLSFVLGVLIAVIFHVDLFAMIQHPDPRDVLFWEDDIFDEGIGFYFSVLLTGFFLSFGSKFFHDLIDTLLQVKNLKSKMVDKETYEIENIKQLDEFIETGYFELARICLRENEDTIKNLIGIKSYYVGLSAKPSELKPVIILHSSLKQESDYPSYFKAKLSSGKEFTIKTEVYYNYSMPKIHLNSGDNVYEKHDKSFKGSLCCNLRKNDTDYFLTCAHVLTGGEDTIENEAVRGWFKQPSKDDSFSDNNSRKPIGTWAFGLIDEQLDAALIEVKSGVQPIANKTAELEVYSDQLIRAEVHIDGNINNTNGFICGYVATPTEFKYNGNIHELSHLILLSKETFGSPRAITNEGDSGALVSMTESQSVLGMVVGGNDDYTYVIPMDRILNATQAAL